MTKGRLIEMNKKSKKMLLSSAAVLSTAVIMGTAMAHQNNVSADSVPASSHQLRDGEIASGTFGSSSWYITSSGVLHIGSGDTGATTWSEGVFVTPWSDYKEQITSIVIDGTVNLNPESGGLFSGLSNATNIENITSLNTSNVTSMKLMFSNSGALTNLDLSNFDTSNVTDMSYMFNGCQSLTSVDLSNFDTTQVTNMSRMFNYCGSLTNLNLSNFDTSKVTDMVNMFHFSALNQLSLGEKTKLDGTAMLGEDNLSMSDTTAFTDKWQSLGTGTVSNPNGSWSGSTDELITRSASGTADTYVLQRNHDYEFTANDLSVKQSEVANLDIIKASKAELKDNLHSDATFELEVKDNGGLTNKAGSYKVTLAAKEAPELTKTITVTVVADSNSDNSNNTNPAVKYQKVYRLYNKHTGEHLYTESSYERDSLVKAGWTSEGTGWSAPNKGTAVYRVYNPNAKGGDHYYTASKYEATSLVKAGWKWDNNAEPIFYSGGKTPVYVAYNPNAQSGSHNYTTSSYEQQSLLNNGWKYGKIQFYGK